jgi:hypothetical protein
MKVFEVHTTAKPPGKFTDYASLLDATPENEKIVGLDDFAGVPFPRKWRRITLCINMPLLPRPDFYGYGGGVFVCNPRAFELTSHAMGMSGELLPVNVQGERGTFYIFNCTDCLNVVDHEKSKWRILGGRYRILKTPAFIDRFGEGTLFKIPEHADSTIYCVERTGNPEDAEFKALVEHHGLTGLRFELIWSSERRRSRRTSLLREKRKRNQQVKRNQ